MATRPKYWYLQHFDLFEGIEEQDLMQIDKFSIEHFFQKKDLVFSPGEKLETVYILKEGEVTLYQVLDGKKFILDILKPGAIFGNISLHPEEESSYFAEATDKVMICALSVEAFLAVVQSYPQIVLRLLQNMTQKVHEYEDRLASVTLLGAKEKVLEAIKIIKEKEAKDFLPKILRKKTKITHEKLAEMTGLARETVTKAISELEKEERIVLDGRKIFLTTEVPQ